MEFHDPFKVDSKRYKDLLNQDSSPKYTPYEDITDEERILETSTFTGLPPSAFQAVKDAQDHLKANEEDKRKVSEMFGNLFTDLNQKYGLNVRFDLDSFSNSLTYIIEPRNKRAMELYLSEAYGRFRVILYQQYLQAIALLSSQILNPSYILSDSMTYADKLEIMKQLYEFMNTMNDIYEKVNIPDTELKLEKLSDDINDHSYNIDDPKALEFLSTLFNNVKDNKK